MSQKTHAVITCAMGIDTGKNTLHLVGLDDRGTIVLREKLGRSRIRTRLANVPPCLIGIEAGMTTHYVARELIALGHDVRQVPLTLTACRRSLPRLRRFALRFEVYPRGHGSRVGLGLLGNDDACAIFLAYSICAGLTGLASGFPGVSPSAFLGACSLRNFRQIDIDVL